MTKSLVALLMVILSVAACAPSPHQYWNNFLDHPWPRNCPGFPSLEEVDQVVEENSALFEELKEKQLINWVQVNACSEGKGAYIEIYHGGQGQIAPVLEIMDEVGARTRIEGEYFERFFGVPFQFVNV